LRVLSFTDHLLARSRANPWRGLEGRIKQRILPDARIGKGGILKTASGHFSKEFFPRLTKN
jgi:hypothetical protein